jgi:hypothetical protein
MSIHLRTVALTSDEILKELVTDSLTNILGESHEVISDSLPFEGHHILALNAERRPCIIAWDVRDGGRALLAGLTAIEGLSDNRAMLYRLYPALFRGNRDSSAIFRAEDMQLAVLAPKPPPGGAYLRHAFRSLAVYTFRILEVDGRVGLLIETTRDGDAAGANPRADAPLKTPAFRAGHMAMTPEEEGYFRRQ